MTDTTSKGASSNTPATIAKNRSNTRLIALTDFYRTAHCVVN